MAISDAELEGYLNTLGEAATKYANLNTSIENLRQRIIENSKDQKDNNDAYKRTMRLRKQEQEDIIKAHRAGNLTAQETQAQLKRLNDSIREVVPEDLKKQFERTVELEDKLNNLRIKGSAALKAANFATDIFGKGLAHSFKLIGGLSPSVDPLSGALDSATESVKLVGSAFKFLGDHAGSAALAAAVLGPEASIAAGGLALFSGVVGDAVTFLGNNIMPVFNTYVKSLSSGFKDAASAGGLFVGGLTELQNTAIEAGVNTETFGKLLREQSENLQLFGGDVVEGGRRVAAVTKQLQKNLGPDYQNYFVKMGYSVQEIPNIIAEVGASVSRTIGGATNEQVARAVQDYAKNLRVLSDLTGQNAKTLQEKAQNEFKDLRYKQYLSDIEQRYGATYRKNLELAASALDPATLNQYKEMIATGGDLFTRTAGVISGQVPAANEAAKALYNLGESGQATGTAFRDTQFAYSKAIAAQIGNTRELALSALATGDNAESVKLLGESFDTYFSLANTTAAEYEKKKAEILAAMETNDEKTQKLAETEIQGMKLKIEAEKAATSALGDYLKGITAINELNIKLIESTGALVKFITDNLPSSSATTRAARDQQALQSNISQQEQDQEMNRFRSRLGIMQTTPSTINQITTPITVGGRTYASPVGTGVNNMTDAEAAEAARNDPRFGGGQAEGGILSGPRNGYLAKLHGTEAVLPENLTALLTDAANSAQTVKEQLPAANVRPNRSEDLLSMLNDKFDDMISLLDDISSHTERTSVRVA